MARFLGILLLLLASAPAAHGLGLQPGDILYGGTSGGIVHLDGLSGTQTLIPTGAFDDFAVGTSLRLYTLSGGAVFEIDPADGSQRLVSAGGSLVDPVAISVGQAGEVFVLDAGAFAGQGGIIQVDPVSGAQTAVSSGGLFGAFASARPLVDMAASPDGDLIVLGRSVSILDEVFRVDVMTGAQTLVSTVDGAGGSSTGVSVDRDGTIFVANFSQCECVVRVDPNDGSSKTWFDGTSTKFLPDDVAIDFSGQLVMTGILLPLGQTMGSGVAVRLGGPFPATSVPASELGILGPGGGEIAVVPGPAIPEPTAVLAFAVGLAVVGWAVARQRTRQAPRSPPGATPL